ncbi:MAG: SDR family NAD(P)-dependent oxidoreductase [Alphaproteobacteria bacterium]|nr:SDR family NAD(P)-dependent oxidoreductase [Alphaproteobacteria bacterium]
MKVIVTGAAGFIGYHAAVALLDAGAAVVGVDNLSPYYDVSLKEARLANLTDREGFEFRRLDITDHDGMVALTEAHPDTSHVLHLAAQAGVRHSLTHPEDYIQINLVGHFEVLEACRRLGGLDHLVYASSSSVYGGLPHLPYSESDPVNTPVSLYAATKKADELISHSYAHLHRMKMTGLRFFTVYGPWGRPDMSAFIFTKAILGGEPIEVFNHGDMRRDFTYVDDIVAGVMACLKAPPEDDGTAAPHRIYNIGNNRAEELMHFVGLIEEACGRKAEIRFQPMQPGDVKESCADISAIKRDHGFEPTTDIDVGIPRSVAWYREFYGV